MATRACWWRRCERETMLSGQKEGIVWTNLPVARLLPWQHLNDLALFAIKPAGQNVTFTQDLSSKTFSHGGGGAWVLVVDGRLLEEAYCVRGGDRYPAYNFKTKCPLSSWLLWLWLGRVKGFISADPKIRMLSERGHDWSWKVQM